MSALDLSCPIRALKPTDEERSGLEMGGRGIHVCKTRAEKEKNIWEDGQRRLNNPSASEPGYR